MASPHPLGTVLPCLPDSSLHQLLEGLDWQTAQIFALLFLAQLLKSRFCSSSWRIYQCLRGPRQYILLCPLMLIGCTCLFTRRSYKASRFLSETLCVVLGSIRYWVRFQRNCFILWTISTFLKFRHLSDPVPQIPLKCFCQMVYQS